MHLQIRRHLSVAILLILFPLINAPPSISVVMGGPHTSKDPISPHIDENLARTRRIPQSTVQLANPTFSPTMLFSGQILRACVDVINNTDTTLSTQGPAPGFQYREDETYASVGHPEISGAFRVAVQGYGNVNETWYPYRWGLGSDLPPGETRRVCGEVILDTPHTADYTIGLVEESIDWLEHSPKIQITAEPSQSALTELAADVSGNCLLDLADVQSVANAWQSRAGHAAYDPAFDFVIDGHIDVRDLMWIVSHLGYTCERQPGEGISLWKGINFIGGELTFTEGHSDFTLLGLNDQIASLTINGPYEARLFEHINYGGQQSAFTTDVADLGSSNVGRYNASSLRMRRLDLTSGVFLYTEPGYQGQWSRFTNSIPNVTNEAIGNDTAASLEIRGNYKVRLWEHAGYQGRSWLFTSDSPAISDAIGKVSALEISASNRSQPLRITVDAGAVLGPLKHSVFGTNAGSWMSNLDQDEDIINKVRASGVTVIRFPGGSASDEYHWKNHEFVEQDNPNTTRTTEFIRFTDLVGAEPLITTNFCSGTAQEAADWVDFTNVDQGKHVKYWEVGNEIYGDWECAWAPTPEEYVNGNAEHDGFNDFCQAMKSVDPSIQVGASGTIYPGQEDDWGPTILDLAGDCMDFYSIHRYPLGPDEYDYWKLLQDAPNAWPAIGDSVHQMLAENAPGRDIDLALTEYNAYYAGPEEPTIQTVNMLFLADTLGQIIEQDISLANHFMIQLSPGDDDTGQYGFLLADPSNYRQPSYYAFPLWKRAGDQRISTTLNRDPGTEMSVYASRHTNNGDVTLIVINKLGVPQTATIDLSGFQAAGRAETFVAQGDSLDDPSVTYNGIQAPPIDLSSVPPLVTTGIAETFSYTFPPYSVTSLTVKAAP